MEESDIDGQLLGYPASVRYPASELHRVQDPDVFHSGNTGASRPYEARPYEAQAAMNYTSNYSASLSPTILPSGRVQLPSFMQPTRSVISAVDGGHYLTQQTGQPQTCQAHQQSERSGTGMQQSRKSQYTTEDWDFHRPLLRELYLSKDMTLNLTMAEMKKKGFEPSVKMYKEKFTQWKWSKNVPKETTLWMNQRINDRKRPTVFVYHDQEIAVEKVQTKAKRIKSGYDTVALQNMPTPEGLTILTPADTTGDQPSPQNQRSTVARSIEESLNQVSPSRAGLRFLDFTKHPRTLADAQAIRSEACRRKHAGDSLNAERFFRDALAGYEAVLSPTHEDSVAVAYDVATFYIDQGRFDAACSVLDRVLENHVQFSGVSNHASLFQFVRVLGLLERWNHHDEAKALSIQLESDLTHATNFDSTTSCGANNAALVSVESSIQTPTTHFSTNRDFLQRLEDAATVGTAEAERLLARLIKRHEQAPEIFRPQVLLTYSAIVEQHRRLGDYNKADIVLQQARAIVDEILMSKSREKGPVFDSCVDVVSLYIPKDTGAGEDLFQKVGYCAEETLGVDNPAVIQLSTRIGLIYQGHKMWSMAQPWFERALCASMAANGFESTVTMKLERAIEIRHYPESIHDARQT